MPYCPACKSEYHPGVGRCPDCDRPLLNGSPPEPPAPPPLPHAPRGILYDPAEAEIVGAALSEAGIPTFIRRQGPITGELGRVTDGITDDYAVILVREDRLPEAKRILDDIQSGPIEWPPGMEPDDEEDAL
ncbi:MAG: DUF2007 domain-containing protein [Armatimonadota bacterium]|nr:MAG: DUF2007 domain-containing protein [Armatimonadota bacterium]